MFKHFLFTRFNLRYKAWEKTRSGNKVLGEEWLTDRFRLFETYCLPSVKNQGNQNFTWFVFFGSQTPELFKNKIKRIEAEYANFHPVFLDDGSEFRPTLIEVIKANTGSQDKYVLTSRIDNDDAIHKDFINTVQSLFQPVHNHVIDFRAGYQLILGRKKNEVLEFTWPFNPFVSLVETSDSAKSIFSREHNHWHVEKSLTAYDQNRLWMAVIHRNNLLNRRQYRLKGVYKFNHADFGISEGSVNLRPRLQTLYYNSVVQTMTLLSFCKSALGRLFKTKQSREKDFASKVQAP